jgi:hypothetical protein
MRRSDKTEGSVGSQGMARRGFFKRVAIIAGVLTLVAVAPGGVTESQAPPASPRRSRSNSDSSS